MFRQLTFGVVVAAGLALCAADLQAQCVGCGGSTPIYSQPINAGVYSYGQPVYGTTAYGQPGCGGCGNMQMTYTAAPISSGCCNTGCAPVQTSCCQPMVRSNCCRPMARRSCCQPVNSCCQPMVNSGCCHTNYANNMTSSCGCGGNVVMGTQAGGGVIMGTVVQPPAGGAVDQANPPVPVETDTKVEEKTPAPADGTETAGEKIEDNAAEKK